MPKYISLIDALRSFRSMTKSGVNSEQALSKALNQREELNEIWNLQYRIQSAEIGNTIVNNLLKAGLEENEALSLLAKFETCLKEVYR